MASFVWTERHLSENFNKRRNFVFKKPMDLALVPTDRAVALRTHDALPQKRLRSDLPVAVQAEVEHTELQVVTSNSGPMLNSRVRNALDIAIQRHDCVPFMDDKSGALVVCCDPDHVCSPETCTYERADCMYEHAIDMLESGVAQRTRREDIYVCPKSGILHVCTNEACESLTYDESGSTFVCWKTGLMRGMVSIQCDTSSGNFDYSEQFSAGKSRSSTFGYGKETYRIHRERKLHERIKAAKSVWVRGGPRCPIKDLPSVSDGASSSAKRMKPSDVKPRSKSVLKAPVAMNSHSKICQCPRCYAGGIAALTARAAKIIKTLIVNLPQICATSPQRFNRMCKRASVIDEYARNPVPISLARTAAASIAQNIVHIWQKLATLLLEEKPSHDIPQMFTQYDKFVIGCVYLGENGCSKKITEASTDAAASAPAKTSDDIEVVPQYVDASRKRLLDMLNLVVNAIGSTAQKALVDRVTALMDAQIIFIDRLFASDGHSVSGFAFTPVSYLLFTSARLDEDVDTASVDSMSVKTGRTVARNLIYRALSVICERISTLFSDVMASSFSFEDMCEGALNETQDLLTIFQLNKC